MYEERKEKFSFKSFFLTLLLVILFILLMLFLFPTRWDLKNSSNDLQSQEDIDRLAFLYDEVFANNVERMKNAAIGYFTTERLPQNINESKKLTLQEMYDLHMILKMKDKNGNACSVTKSYVEMTKYENEYHLKVNLSCGEQEDYIIVYLGCYSYCTNGICEKRVEEKKEVAIVDDNNDTDDDSQYEQEQNKDDADDNNDEHHEEKHYCEIIDGKYYNSDGDIVNKEKYIISCNITPTKKSKLYEYKLVVDDQVSYSDWSNWQEDYVSEDENTTVETKDEKVLSGYKTVTVQTGVESKEVTKVKTESYISGYSTKLVYNGTTSVQVGTTTEEVTEKVQVGTVEKYYATNSGSIVPDDTSTMKYKLLSSDTVSDCSYCENKTVYIWEEYTIEPVYDVVTTTNEVPVWKNIDNYLTVDEPIWDIREVEYTEIETTPVYKDIQYPEYKTVTYYRYKTKNVISGYSDVTWSKSNKDLTLMLKGYKLTGNVKEV